MNPRVLFLFQVMESHSKHFSHITNFISVIFVSFTLLGGHCLYNSCLLMYYPILGVDLITESCKRDLSFKWPSALRYLTPEDKYIKLILFYFQFVLLFSDLFAKISELDQNQVNILSLFCEKKWFHPRNIFIKILCFVCFIDIPVIKPIPMTIEI